MQDKGRFLSGVSLAIGLVLAAWIGAGALVRIKTQDQTITVTGSARRQIVSDAVVWRAYRCQFPRARQAVTVEHHKAMAELVETLMSEAMQLPPDQRLTLAHRILSSLEP